jgi:uncharacterized protein YjaG (DUF416 family)
MEPEFNEGELKQKLIKLPFWKQLAFLLIVCQRLLPSFQAFAAETGFQGKSELAGLLTKAWDSLLNSVSSTDFSSEATLAESLAPDTEDFDSAIVSSALDAAIATSLLMKAFSGQQTDTIVEAVTLIRDSVDMYAQELEDMDPADPDLEKNILGHELMQKELRRQREDLEFLGTLDDDISVSMIAVKNKWFNSEESCLGLMQ